MAYEEIITSSKTAASGGTALSLVTTGEKYTWNAKQNALTFTSTPSSTNKVVALNDLNSGLDKKVQKTSVSSANKTTSTIAITDNSQMAMVASIKGKTVKSKNLLNPIVRVVSDNGITFTTVVGSNGDLLYVNINGTVGSEKTYATTNIMTSVNTELNGCYLTAGCSSTNKVRCGVQLATSPYTVFANAQADSWTQIGVITGNSNVYIRVMDSGTVCNNIHIFPMISKTRDIPFEPYFEGLRSAPVESVVSEGINHFSFDNMYDLRASVTAVGNGYYKILSTAAWSYTNTRVYNLKVNTKYKIFIDTSEKSAANLYVAVKRKDANTNYNTLTLNAGQVTSYEFTALETEAVISINPNNSSTASTTAYVTVRVAIIESSLNPTGYVPYNKTTVLVPQSIRNLPDYGVDGNIVDFENGVYNHNYTITNNAVAAYTGSDKVIPITDYLRPLPVENGGTITLVNEHNLDVNSTIKFKKEV